MTADSMTMKELSSQLDMFAAQLRESLTGGGSPPRWDSIDLWVDKYTRALREQSR